MVLCETCCMSEIKFLETTVINPCGYVNKFDINEWLSLPYLFYGTFDISLDKNYIISKWVQEPQRQLPPFPQ